MTLPFVISRKRPAPKNAAPAFLNLSGRSDVQWSRPRFQAPDLNLAEGTAGKPVFCSQFRMKDRLQT